MPKSQRFAVLLTLAVALTAIGCRKPAADDATVTAAVQTRLAGDSALGSESIQSSVQAGVATLSGAVSSEAARALAANDAAQVAGVRTVVNNLSVGNNAGASQQQPTFPNSAPAPAVSVNTPPTRVPTIPVKPSAAVERQKIRGNALPQQSAAAPVERAPQQQNTQQQNTQQTASAAPPQPAFRNIDVPSGTAIPVRITQTLDSATTQQGASFSGVVASDVVVDGLVAIPQGSAVTGRVDAVQEAAHFSGNSLLTIEVTSISRGGERIPVSTAAYSKQGAGRGRNTAIKTGAGAAAGAILGGIFGGGKGAAIGAAAGGGTGAGINGVTRGDQVQIPSESLIPFRLTSSVNVRASTRNEVRPGDDRYQPEGGRRPLQ